jgi:hypothetical protein
MTHADLCARGDERDFVRRGGDRGSWRLGIGARSLSIAIPVRNELQTIGRIVIEVAKALPEFPSKSSLSMTAALPRPAALGYDARFARNCLYRDGPLKGGNRNGGRRIGSLR